MNAHSTYRVTTESGKVFDIAAPIELGDKWKLFAHRNNGQSEGDSYDEVQVGEYDSRCVAMQKAADLGAIF